MLLEILTVVAGTVIGIGLYMLLVSIVDLLSK
jgi:hypothetical protein